MLRAPRKCVRSIATTPFEALAKKGCCVHYVYPLKSVTTPDERYVGLTTDLRRRIAEHNAGESSLTAKYRPWELVTYLGFSNRKKAEQFERYLKSGSGHAFARRHLW
jgi:putative endonuclease